MTYTSAAETQPVREIDLGRTCFPVFKDATDSKEQALKPLEEAAEVFAAWQQWDKEPSMTTAKHVTDEVCDLLQAAMNLLAGIGSLEIEEAIECMIERNEARGREYA